MEEECKVLRHLFVKLLEAKKQGAGSEQLREIAAHVPLAILGLKQTHKALCERGEELKSATAKARASLDTSHLQLQNLLYEKSFYEKEISSCRNFTSAYSEEDMDLLSESDFLASADKQWKEGIEEPHKLMLQRLGHEIALRKEMLQSLEALKARRDALAAQVGQKRKRLDASAHEAKVAAQVALTSYQKVSAGLAAWDYRLQSVSQDAALLPLPLYILYTQMTAFQEALDLPITMTISGDKRKAKELAAREAAAARSAGGNGGEGGSSAGEERGSGGERRRSKRARSDKEVAPASEEAQLYEEHPLLVTLTLTDPEGGPLQGGPAAAAPPPLSVIFRYLPRLRLVTAACSDPAENPLLGALFPGDSGAHSPAAAHSLLLGGRFQFDAKRPDRPYRWAQRLGGLDFMPELPPGAGLIPGPADLPARLQQYREQRRATAVISALRFARKSHAALSSQLQSLKQLKLPAFSSAAELLPQAPTCTLHRWEETAVSAPKQAPLLHPAIDPPPPPPARLATPPSVQQGPVAMDEDEEGEEGELPEEGPAAMDESSDAIPAAEGAVAEFTGVGAVVEEEAPPGAAARQQHPHPEWRRFRLVLQREGIELEAVASLFAMHPVCPPRVSVRSVRAAAPPRRASREKLVEARPELASKADIAAIEQEVNIGIVDRLPHDDLATLPCQLLQLMAAFDARHAGWAAKSGAPAAAAAPAAPAPGTSRK